MIIGVRPEIVIRKKEILLFISIVLPLISFFVSYISFKSHFFIAYIFFIVLPAVNYIFEYFDEKDSELAAFFKLHDFRMTKEDIYDIFDILVTFMVGVTIGNIILYLILPEDIKIYLFKEPITIISSFLGKYLSEDPLFYILKNNLKVFLISFLISLLYFTGSTVIISWNASLFGMLIGELLLREKPLSVLFGYFIHAIPEFFAYILAGISGNLLSFAFTKKYSRDVLFEIMKYSLRVFILGILVLIIAASLETTISPIFVK